jgi:hypothetical protein
VGAAVAATAIGTPPVWLGEPVAGARSGRRASTPTSSIGFAAGRPERTYRDAAGRRAELWTIPEAAHTGGLRSRPAEHERRTTAFVDRALRTNAATVDSRT